MARLQIVTLPTFSLGGASRSEFLIVLDQVDDRLVTELSEAAADIRELTGARCVLVFESTIEILR